MAHAPPAASNNAPPAALSLPVVHMDSVDLGELQRLQVWLGGLPLNATRQDISTLFYMYELSEDMSRGEDACKMETLVEGDTSKVAIVTMVSEEKAKEAAETLRENEASMGYWILQVHWRKSINPEMENQGRNASPQAVLVARKEFERKSNMFPSTSWTRFVQQMELPQEETQEDM